MPILVQENLLLSAPNFVFAFGREAERADQRPVDRIGPGRTGPSSTPSVMTCHIRSLFPVLGLYFFSSIHDSGS